MYLGFVLIGCGKMTDGLFIIHSSQEKRACRAHQGPMGKHQGGDRSSQGRAWQEALSWVSQEGMGKAG